MVRDILSIRAGECRYCVTDDSPFFFCGDPVADGSSYCPPHHAVCHAGFGLDVRRTESMIYAFDHSVVRTGRNADRAGAHRATESPVTVAVDVAIRGSA